jgi:hypothetical protein
MRKISLTALFVLLSYAGVFAQLKFGTDVYSRYIWRGLNLGGDSPAFQPSITYSSGGFSIGAWGSYSFPGSSVSYSENDLTAILATGPISFCLTDYYIPSAGIPFGFYKPRVGADAAHTLEGGDGYTGPEIFPISLSAYYNFSNDPDNSSYIQIGYTFIIQEATMSIQTGISTAKSAYYGTSKMAVTNINATLSKSVKITEYFSIPINVSYTINPNQDISYLIFGMSLVL